MIARLSRLLAVLILGATLAVVTQSAAHACSCAESPFAQLVDGADAVFTGTLIEGDASQATAVYTIKVNRVYKGEIKSTQVQVSSAASGSTCGLEGMIVGSRYLFLAQGQADALQANLCGGTQPATSAITQKVTKLVGDGTVPTQPPAEEATFERVADAIPPALSKLLAPGGAMVIIGLLGLVVLRRFGRAG